MDVSFYSFFVFFSLFKSLQIIKVSSSLVCSVLFYLLYIVKVHSKSHCTKIVKYILKRRLVKVIFLRKLAHCVDSSLHHSLPSGEKVGQSGKEKLPFSSKKPPVQPEPSGAAICLTGWDQRGQEKDPDKHRTAGSGEVSMGRKTMKSSC